MTRSTEPRAQSVDKLVEHEILPRLLVAHSSASAGKLDAPKPRDSSPIARDLVRRLAPLVLEMDAAELLQQIESLLERGASVESVFIDVLAPTAKKLGEYWAEDSCDFVDVTMGLWRLQEIMREIALRYPNTNTRKGSIRSALFAPAPGDQHSFGALMIDEVFSRAGWDSEALPETQRPQLLQICSEHAFDLVGLTVTNDCHSADLANLVTAIRSVSKNKQVKVIIGGRAVQADPSLVEITGADGTADSAVAALALADRLVPSPALVGNSVL